MTTTQSQSLSLACLNGPAVINNPGPTSLLSLPHDLLEQILLQLDAQDLVTSALISRLFKTIIHSSILLQYHIACHAAGVVDNPHSKISYAERYNALMKREKAWSRFQPVFSKTFDVLHRPSSIYSLETGVYLSGDIGDQGFHYCTLPSTPDDVPRWSAIHGHDQNRNWDGTIIDVGTAIHEHDLIINVIASPGTFPVNNAVHSLDMILFQLSTGEYHPSAHFPRIHVQNFSTPLPFVAVEVVGDNLAMVVNIRWMPENARLFVFDWKRGYKRLEHETTTLYNNLAFLSPEILLVPDATQGRYEIWKIPVEADDTPHRILSLCLPSLSAGHSILNFYCHVAPNPCLHDQPHESHRPFQNSVENAVIVNTIYLASAGIRQSHFAHVMLRRSLLNTISNLTRTDKPISSYTRDQLSQLGNIYGVDSEVPWSEWGPLVSRWFGSDVGGLVWIPPESSSGQRWAVLDNLGTGNRQLKIIDFNPYNIHRASDGLAGEMVVRKKGEYFHHDNIFAEDIEMGLGCIIYTAPETCDFHVVLMDEERLLGLKMNRPGNVEKITVLYFG